MSFYTINSKKSQVNNHNFIFFKVLFTISIIFTAIISVAIIELINNNYEFHQIRNDNALRLTYSDGSCSNQNPAFSPDGKYIIFTRFLNGYNIGPSQIIKLCLSNLTETILFSSEDSDNVNVPGPCWINNKICWSSDRAGESDEIYIADDTGINISQITEHPESIGYYIEPIFNPTNINQIIFEYGPSDTNPHRISLVELDKNNKVTYLTDGILYDDRLPNWSFDGKTILFQRANISNDNWGIYIANLDFSEEDPKLVNISKIDQPNSHNTDNSWYIDNKSILSSSDYNIPIPNIYMFSLNGEDPLRITNSNTNEDGAPSSSPDGKMIAFESHIGQDEETPSDIWIINLDLDST